LHNAGIRRGVVLDLGCRGGQCSLKRQMAFWTCSEAAPSETCVHELDEYVVVIEGSYTLMINGRRISLNAGQECFIPRGAPHSRRSFSWIKNNSRFWRS
jgi:mannose-6-phosphate isomerase-like protein (cupin superfamily)